MLFLVGSEELFSNFMNKKVLTISIVLFLAIAMIAGFLVWKNQGKENNQVVSEKTKNVQTKNDDIQKQSKPNEVVEDIAEWKTYRNDEYGFKFKYPSNWDVHEFKAFKAGLPADGIDCNKNSEKCTIYSLSIKPEITNVDAINMSIMIQLLQNDKSFAFLDTEKRNNEWMDGFFVGCFSKFVKKNNEVRFLMWNLYEPNLKKDETFLSVKEKCLNYTINPFFDRVVESFNFTK